MCFSAEASFSSGIVLSAVGIATLTKTRIPAQKLFAGIPLLFGLQQLAEGVLWVTLKSGGREQFQNAAVYTFLITALVLWPVIIPLSMRLMEKTRNRRKILIGFLVSGCITSLLYSFCLIFYDVTPQIQSFHIQYIANFPSTLLTIALAFYLVSTIAPLFISSIRRMWLFGVLITVSCIVTIVFYSQYLTSVWCFFAALISVAIYWVLSGTSKNTNQTATESQA